MGEQPIKFLVVLVWVLSGQSVVLHVYAEFEEIEGEEKTFRRGLVHVSMFAQNW